MNKIMWALVLAIFGILAGSGIITTFRAFTLSNLLITAVFVVIDVWAFTRFAKK